MIAAMLTMTLLSANADHYAATALQLSEQGEHTAAIDLAEAAAELEIGNPHRQILLARIHITANQLDEALNALGRAEAKFRGKDRTPIITSYMRAEIYVRIARTVVPDISSEAEMKQLLTDFTSRIEGVDDQGAKEEIASDAMRRFGSIEVLIQRAETLLDTASTESSRAYGRSLVHRTSYDIDPIRLRAVVGKWKEIVQSRQTALENLKQQADYQTIERLHGLAALPSIE